jgi:hypothetical protein
MVERLLRLEPPLLVAVGGFSSNVIRTQIAQGPERSPGNGSPHRCWLM